MSTLSPMQQSILRWLLKCILIGEQHNRQSANNAFAAKPSWTPKTGTKDESKTRENVWRASVCRALARLEKRGLITRIKSRKKARTVRVRLTAEGRKVAESMSGN
jgi:hypothetical protein